MQIPPASKHSRLFKIRNVNWPFYMSLLYFKWVIVECRLPAGTGSIQNSSLNKSITSSMESLVMRNLAFRLCYSIIEWLMKKTTSSLLIPKIRFPLIKCHRWKGASSDLTKVSLVCHCFKWVELWETQQSKDKCMEREKKMRADVLWRKIKKKGEWRVKREAARWWMVGRGVGLQWRGKDRKSQTERFLPIRQHNHSVCLRLAWQRHH